jgi:type I restriction enzyme, S subunit
VTDTELELPKGWVETTVENIGQIVTGNTPSKKDSSNYGNFLPWVKPPQLDSQIPIENTPEKLSKKGASVARVLEKNSILISCIGDLGKLGIAGTKLSTNQQINSVTCFDEIHYKFAYYFFQSPIFLFWLEANNSATVIKIINKGRLSKAPFLLPPLNEQKRIVSKIEELFSKIDFAKQSLEHTKLQLEQYRQSLLKSAFEGKLTKKWREENKDNVGNVKKFLEKFTVNNFTSSILKPSKSTIPEIWDFALSNHVFDFITSGSRGWAKFYSETGSIFIRITNLNYNSIELDFQKIKRVNPPSNSEGIRTKVKPNDILISITGDVGMIALVPEDMPNSYVNQHICLARPYNEINAKYIALYLISDNAKKQFTTLKKGAVKSGLGLGDIRSVWIPFPPLEEQKEIIARIEQGFSLIENTSQIVNSSLQNLQTMKMSVLKQAFEGKLVPQDPNDEPASVLLEKIKLKN